MSRRAAHRTELRHDEFPLTPSPSFGNDLNHLWNHVTRSLNHNSVANADVLAPDLILIVERGSADDYASDINGLQHGQRRQRPGAADIDDDVVDAGCLLGRREFVCRGPARLSGDETQFLLLPKVIDFDDHAVDLEWQ